MAGDGKKTKKKWWKSKTMLFNAAAGALLVAEQNQPVISAIAPGSSEAIAAFVVIGNVLLRLATSQPVGR